MSQRLRTVVLQAQITDDARLHTIEFLPTPYPLARILSYSAPDSAYEGEAVTVSVEIINDGVEGVIWAQVVDIETDEVVGSTRDVHAIPDTPFTLTWSDLVMPHKDWKLEIQVGHYE